MTKEFTDILNEMESVHDKKNYDYTSGEPFENFTRAAMVSSWFKNDIDKVFAILITIKLARLATLLGSIKVPNNESLPDTFIDLPNYAVLWGAYHRSISKSVEK